MDREETSVGGDRLLGSTRKVLYRHASATVFLPEKE